MEPDIVLRTEHLSKTFVPMSTFGRRTGHEVLAVDDISLEIRRGETFGLVGESGSGKTTLGKVILRLIEPTSGRIWVNGRDVTGLDGSGLQRFREQAQMVFQDPYSSLNPKMTMRQIVGEPLLIHRGLKGDAAKTEIVQLLELVGLNAQQMDRRPHEFSGGQRQRIGIARALALRPSLLILDEPTAALDVSVQAHIVQLLVQLQKELDLTMIFISHDLALVSLLCDRIGVMYRGRLVETESSDKLFRHPQHPYTKVLLASVPQLEPGTLVAPPLEIDLGAMA